MRRNCYLCKKKWTLKLELVNFTGFSTKSVPDQYDSPDNTITWEPKIHAIWGPTVFVKKNLTASILEWQYILFCLQNVAPRLAQYGWH